MVMILNCWMVILKAQCGRVYRDYVAPQLVETFDLDQSITFFFQYSMIHWQQSNNYLQILIYGSLRTIFSGKCRPRTNEKATLRLKLYKKKIHFKNPCFDLLTVQVVAYQRSEVMIV